MPVAVKVCGLTTPEAVDAAVEHGAVMIGLVFYPPSPRSLALDVAARLAARVPAAVKKVGVFVDPDDATLERTLAVVPLDLIQLHGAETPARAIELRRRTGCPVMKAIRISVAADLQAVPDHAAVAGYLLFDAKAPAGAPVPGGNGLAFDWRLLDGLESPRPWLLSGGLNVANLEAAVRLTGATMVDVSSGVELRPGVKDPGRIEAFLRLARSLEPRSNRTATGAPA